MSNLFRMILSNGFPRLRICTAVGIIPLTSSEAWTGSPALQYLHLDVQPQLDQERLRAVCPGLRRFTDTQSLLSNSPMRMVLFSSR